MKEWIITNTDVTEEEYDNLINPSTIEIEGKREEEISLTPNKPSEHPMLIIDLFTQKEPNLKRKIKYKVRRKKDISKRDYFIYKKIKFYILAQIIKEMQDILYSLERNGKCFELSSKICFKYLNTSIITTVCIDPTYKEPLHFLHAATLFKSKNGEQYIFDTTFNISIDKETYLKLLNAKIISNIPREKLSDDIKSIIEAGLSEYINLEEYLCFPDKIMSGVKKITRNKNQES